MKKIAKNKIKYLLKLFDYNIKRNDLANLYGNIAI